MKKIKPSPILLSPPNFTETTKKASALPCRAPCTCNMQAVLRVGFPSYVRSWNLWNFNNSEVLAKKPTKNQRIGSAFVAFHGVLRGFPRPAPGFSWFSGKTHRAAYTSSPRPWFITMKGYKARSAKGKDAWGRVQRKPDRSFEVSSPSKVTQDAFDFSNNELWHVWTWELIRFSAHSFYIDLLA